MKIQIVDYEKEYDSQLLNFFYKSIFHDRDEFEYTRPFSWFHRYSIYKSPIIKIAKHGKKIVGTLGIIPAEAIVNGKILKGGYFVDNCVSPEYLQEGKEILLDLFKSIENEAKKQEYKFIAGWDYLKNFKQNLDLYSSLGFSSRFGANWFVGGLELKRGRPKKWRGNKKLYWGTAFIILKLYNCYKALILPKKFEDVEIIFASKENLETIAAFLNNNHPAQAFHPYYTKEILEHLWNNIGYRFLLAKKKDQLIAVLSFTVSTWTGMMYGKPFNKEWEEFRTITPDEFVISNDWIHSNLPVVMLWSLLNFDKKYGIDSGSNGVVSTVFDRGINWELSTYKTAGFLEARADFGVFLAKSLNEFKFDTTLPWSIPARAIIAPYPSWIK